MVMTVIRTLSVLFILGFLVLSAASIPAMAASPNGGSSGSDGAGSGGPGGSGNGGGPGGSGNGGGNAEGQPGNSGSGPEPGVPEGPQAQPLPEERVMKQQETVEQPGVQIQQHDWDRDQTRTRVDETVESTSPDIMRQRDRDLFFQQVSQVEQNLSRDQDREQAHVDLALFALSRAGNLSGTAGPELVRLAEEVNASHVYALRAEQQIRTRSSFMRMLIGGDREAARQMIQYADQNQQRIQAMAQMIMNCSDCDPQVRVMLEEQVQVLAREQNRLLTLGQQEMSERGLFGWLF